jgi:tetratricopeptide (TPR) repeat protein
METNIYLIKALDAYPYNLEEAIESLNYALSYDPDNAIALTLSGRFYAEICQDYERALDLFEKVLAVNPHFTMVYSHYIEALINNEDFDKAQSFIDFALKVKSANKPDIAIQKARILEHQMAFEESIRELDQVILKSVQMCQIEEAEEHIKRIKKKMEKMKKDKTETTGKKKKRKLWSENENNFPNI